MYQYNENKSVSVWTKTGRTRVNIHYARLKVKIYIVFEYLKIKIFFRLHQMATQNLSKLANLVGINVYVIRYRQMRLQNERENLLIEH